VLREQRQVLQRQRQERRLVLRRELLERRRRF
jgi:hypothetical protein